MPNVTSVITRTIRARVGWNGVGGAVSVAIVASASIALFHVLREIDVAKVGAALQTTPVTAIVLAGCFVFSSFVTLTFYDFFSLRTIGRQQVPYRIAALASFISYSMGHNLGGMVFTGGAVRFRIYSAWGLSLIEIAKIAFITGLTFWLGNAFVLGLGMIFAPEAASAIDQLPPWMNQVVGLLGLATIVGYLVWLLPRARSIGRDSWQIVLPNAMLTLVQIGIGVLDLGSGALAMYMLMPGAPAIDFTALMMTFVVAMLLGFLSHAPGGLGVFEVTMLIALPQFPREALLASLLIFRSVYFLLPFCFAALLLAARELWLAAR